MSSLLRQARQAMTPQVIQSLSSLTGESSAAIGRGLSAALPAVLAGATTLGSTRSGAERLHSLIVDGDDGQPLLSSLFGGREAAVVDSVARAADMPRAAAGAVLAVAASIVMAVLGREMVARGLGLFGITQVLAGERSAVASLLPAGLGSLLGVKTAGVRSWWPPWW